MTKEYRDFLETTIPIEIETELVQESGRRLDRFFSRNHQQPLQMRSLPDDATEETITIPEAAIRLLSDILTQIAMGNAVRLIPSHAELNTQQAADFLHVSHPFLIEQLEKNVIPYRKVGSHRRILLKDLLAYKKAIDLNRLKTLDELAAQAQELGMGY